MHVPPVICGCGAEMEIEKTGILVEMIASWGPYYKTYGDKYACSNCDASVILPSKEPAVMHFESRYDLYKPDMQGRFIN